MNEWSKIKRKVLGEIPQIASENIKAPETAPSDKRITGRTKQLNLKVKEETYWLLKEIALKEKGLMTEVLEKALKSYEQKDQSINTLQQTLKNIEKQIKPLQGSMSWKEVESKLSRLNPTLFNQVGLSITYEVLKETLQEFSRLDKEKRWNNGSKK